MAYDLLIKNGRVVDGSGEPAFAADVAVQDGKIVGVGKYAGAAAKRTIDAAGRVVAPGFIDHHTHFDPQAVWDPYCGSWVHNGHTTVVVGQCGQVIAPVRPGDSEWYLEFFSDAEQIPLPVLKAGVDVTWESVGDYLNALGKKRGINVGTLVGHSGIRRYVMGEAASERQATPEEMAAMQRLIREAMHDGALGFSTAPKDRGDPAGVGDDEERWALASVLGELGTGVFQVAGGAPGGTKQTREVARELAARTGRPSIYNLMSDPIANPDEWVEHLRWLEDGFKSGARCYGSCLSTVAGAIFDLQRGLNVPQDEDITHPEGIFRGMPTWDKVMALPYQERMRAFRDPELRKALSAEAVEGTVAQQGGMTDRRGRARGFFNRRWDLVEVFMTTKGQNRHLEGKSVAQIAKEQNKGIMDAFLDLSLDEDLNTCFHGDRPQQRSEGAEAHPRLAIYRDRHQRRRRPAAYRRPARDQHQSAGPLGARTAGDDARRGGLSADRQDRADARHYRSRLHRRRQGRRHHDLRSRHDRIEAARAGRERCPAGGVQVKRDAVGIDYVVVNGSVLLDKGELTDALPGQIIRGPLYQGARA